MNKWYLFVWRELTLSRLYIVTLYNNIDEAILKLFELGERSSNEYSKELENLKKDCETSKIICGGSENGIPQWILVHESELNDMVRRLEERNFKVFVKK